ncbi:MAG: hypothetical protein NWP83_07040, partial [Spirosomaceae bacterium]|nr:hypothetical protein [Spirosomataceae bacterium]
MRAIITSLFICLSVVYVNAQSVAIAYADIAHGNFGGTYAGTASGSNFFAAEVISETGNRLIRVKKYNADGAFLTTNIHSDGCQTCNTSGQIPIQIFPASDGGAFLYYELTSNTPVLKKIASGGNVVWTQTYNNLKFVKATPTSGNGLFVVFRATSGININRYFIYNLTTTGSTNWTRDLANSLPTDIVATLDNGIIIADADSTKRMSNAGTKLWSVNRGSNLVRVVDSDFGYQADANRVIRFSLSNGNIDFVRNQVGVNDLLVTPDKAIVFSTNDRIQKLSTSGNNIFTTTTG